MMFDVALESLGFDDREKEQCVSVERMRAAFRSLASGVVIVTCWVDGRPWGLTVNSCCSVSIEPPRVLVSLQRRTRSRVAIEASGLFGLAILAADQKDVAELAALAGKPKFLDEFCDPREGNRPPAVRSAIAQLDCAVYRTIPVDDHVLLVADVKAVIGTRDREPEPLIYFNRSYRLIGGQP
jgi:flavin reductase (DIM6/NTAB) family NADH-FMN oxidoreductase RutF